MSQNRKKSYCHIAFKEKINEKVKMWFGAIKRFLKF